MIQKQFALWKQLDRNITVGIARQLCENAIVGNDVSLPASKTLKYFLNNRGYTRSFSDCNILVHRHNFLFFEYLRPGLPNDILKLALYDGLLMYNYSANLVISCSSRFGLGKYGFFMGNGYIFDDPTHTLIYDCLLSLNIIFSPYAVLDGPDGYICAIAKRDGSYRVEFNSGAVNQNYAIDIDDVHIAIELFDAYLANDLQKVNSYQWVRQDRACQLL